MNDAADLTPAPAPPSAQSWLRRHRLPLVAGGAVLGIGVLSASAALVLSQNAATTVEQMVPATADAMLLASLDPSVGQKVNLLRAMHRFPDTKTDQAITDAVDKAFKGTGLSYRGDIQPWLGRELGASVRLNFDNNADTTAVFYAMSRDDTRAKAFLARLRTIDSGKKLQWRDEAYRGFTISVGTPSGSSAKAQAYSYVDHVVVLATSSAVLHDVIDTEQGRAPRLVESSSFKATVAGLPGDRVGLAYVNGPSLTTGVKKQLAKVTAVTKPSMGNIADLDAFTGIGAALSATPDGLATDLVIKLDQAKLSASARQALASTSSPRAVLGWIPKRTDALFAAGNLNRTVQSLLDASKSDPSIQADTDALGLTGPGGVLPHLTGDAAIEAQIDSTATPSGAILVATDDAPRMAAFFNRLLTIASSSAASLLPSSPSIHARPNASSVPVKPGLVLGTRTTTYRGVTITSMALPPSALAVLTPSYAVVDGMGVLGSSLNAVRAVIDAHQGAQTIAADPTYKATAAASLAKPTSILYLNVASLLQALGRMPIPGTAPAAETRALAAVEPIKALMMTATSGADQLVERVFLLIQ